MAGLRSRDLLAVLTIRASDRLIGQAEHLADAGNGLSAHPRNGTKRRRLVVRNQGIRRVGKDLAHEVKLLAELRRRAIVSQSVLRRACPSCTSACSVEFQGTLTSQSHSCLLYTS